MRRLSKIALILLFFSSCAEKDINLGNGYRLVEVSRGNGAIVNNSNSIVVYPNVVDYRVVGVKVIGRREISEDNIDPNDRRFTSGLGNFILDLSSGVVRLDVSEEEISEVGGAR